MVILKFEKKKSCQIWPQNLKNPGFLKLASFVTWQGVGRKPAYMFWWCPLSSKVLPKLIVSQRDKNASFYPPKVDHHPKISQKKREIPGAWLNMSFRHKQNNLKVLGKNYNWTYIIWWLIFLFLFVFFSLMKEGRKFKNIEENLSRRKRKSKQVYFFFLSSCIFLVVKNVFFLLPTKIKFTYRG